MAQTLRQRKRGKPVNVAINTDFQEEFPSAFYRSIHLKLSGTMTASAAGVNAGDGAFGLLGRVELVHGGKPKIAMQAPDLRHLCAFLSSGYPEALPASISTGAPFLAQVELPLDQLIQDGGIDCRRTDLIVRGRLRGLTNLGTTVTALSAAKLRFGGETDMKVTPDEDGNLVEHNNHFEPNWFQRTIDTSSASSELNTTYRTAEDVEIVPAIMIRTFDASAELSDPNLFRSDGMIREIVVTYEPRGGSAIEVKRLTWGEAKMASTTIAGITASAVQPGVVIFPLDDPSNPAVRGLRMERGGALTIRIDTAATIEDEFTALTVGAGDLAFVTFLNFLPRGDGVDLAKRIRAARGN